MLKILVVDDEILIRQWFVFCIEKSSESYEVVGEAENGLEALELYKKLSPDIIITDIKMPVMDGIELMKQIRSINRSTDFVVLTCHADFDYAREAIKFGAAEYMLKTEVEQKQIINILEKIEKARNEKINSDKAIQIHSQNMRNRLFYDILESKRPDGVCIKERLTELEINLNGRNIFALAIRPYNTSLGLANGAKALKSKAEEIFEAVFFFIHNNTVVLFGNTGSNPSLLMQNHILKEAVKRIEEKGLYSIGISKIHNGLDSLKACIEEALWALEQEFFEHRGSIIYSEAISEDENKYKEVDNIQKSLFKAINEASVDSIIDLAEKVFELFELKKIRSIEYIHKVCTDILDMTYNKLHYDMGINNIGKVDYINEVKNKLFLSELKAWVIEILREMLSFVKLKKPIYSSSVRKALNYIEEHYHEDTSQKRISRYLHLSPEYFCKIFKEEVGCNYSIYVIKFRMEKAQKLLQDSDMKIYEIAERVGYHNLSYFSRLFKKYYNISPFNFKKMLK